MLSAIPKRNYTHGETPLHRLPRLEKALGDTCPEIWIKRDDLTGLTLGGNKTRKLEYLVADALEKGADTLVTIGAIQSNHCRLTASAAVAEGLDCALVLDERVPDTYDKNATGNNLLYTLLGVSEKTIIRYGSKTGKEIEALADELKRKGKKPYLIPGGGSNEIGSLGYVACALEIQAQCTEKNIDFDYIVTTSGSAGTHAGLTVGVSQNPEAPTVLGVSVMRNRQDQEALVTELSKKIQNKLGLKTPFQPIDVDDNYVGDGYGVPTEAMKEATTLLAQTEGILLDPIYTGKAFAGFVDWIRKCRFNKTDKCLFIHTGGVPALFQYKDVWLNRQTRVSV